jgi:hypothetical protein
MWIIIGGVISLVLGAIGVIVWWWPLLSFLAGVIPVFLIIGGAIAIYFGIDELRYPAPKEAPSPEAVSESTPEAAKEVAEEPAAKRTFWLLSYSSKNIQIMQQTQRLAVPPDKSDVLLSEMKEGDHVIIYAAAPVSKFAGVVEIKGGPSQDDNLPFEPSKGEEAWRHYRPVAAVETPPEEKWVESKRILQELDLLEDARNKGRSLPHSFAAKLREIPRLSQADYDRLLRALRGD